MMKVRGGRRRKGGFWSLVLWANSAPISHWPVAGVICGDDGDEREEDEVEFYDKMEDTDLWKCFDNLRKLYYAYT